jgi:hypothetical protein
VQRRRRSAAKSGTDCCISFGGMRIDRAVGAEVIGRLQPLGVEALSGPSGVVQMAAARAAVFGERHVRGFCGMFPTRSASGGVERPGQQLTKAGNDRIKKALFLAADTARRQWTLASCGSILRFTVPAAIRAGRCRNRLVPIQSGG